MENTFKIEQITHLVLAQYHRWYQVYEIPFTDNTIANQKDILSDDVEIISQAGTSKGKNGLEERLKVFTGWRNAHHVQKTEIKLLEDGNLSLEADILYQNIRPDNSKYSYKLHYSTILRQRANDLPVFTLVSLQPTDLVEEFKFDEAYTENRVKSFMHYWLYLMECPNYEKFKELLDRNFELNLSSDERISDFETFKTWIDSPLKIKTSSHIYKNLKIVENNDDTIGVSVSFDWKGIDINNQQMIAETRHEWQLSNNIEERFARMKQMKVTTIKPFQIVENFK
ncbi:hypothetical protein [Solitalea lacus]|uniref:hypothetical protein n=1 Tax=Solitalea lacus TaxID=2911172 RepID=UPI001EDC76AD|nr:hypothetical protein [Solitalea lacus]UKJ05805.1 hypothetical protein L2B55_09615 [Solitalea lacus]